MSPVPPLTDEPGVGLTPQYKCPFHRGRVSGPGNPGQVVRPRVLRRRGRQRSERFGRLSSLMPINASQPPVPDTPPVHSKHRNGLNSRQSCACGRLT